jgi:ATP-binding cassette, subfamily B, bacterial
MKNIYQDMPKKFPHYHQPDIMDCGPTCLKMIAEHYGRRYSLPYLRERCYLTREGVSMLGISQGAEAVGLRTLAVKIDYQRLSQEVPLPCIVHWNQTHFVVVYKVSKNLVYVSDPASSLLQYPKADFLKSWLAQGEIQGIALLLEPTPDFYQSTSEQPTPQKGFGYLRHYLSPYRLWIVQILLGLLLGAVLQFLFPFLTQSIVDNGIHNQNLGFIQLVLVAQLMLFFSRVAVEVIRTWLMLHLSSRLNILLISDFLAKLMRLPVSFFDSKMTGDLMQRIGDQQRIQQFLSVSTLNTLFSFINLLIFGLILAFYNLLIFSVFAIGSLLYFAWILAFLKRRKALDYQRFQQMAGNQSSLIQLIQGMPEIKLQTCETSKRWAWERIQAKIFRLQIKSTSLEQTQMIGSQVITEIKNILITFISATAVLQGQMTLGMMLAVQYIIGQLNSPLQSLIQFVQDRQDAQISLDRLNEIQELKNETDREFITTLLPENQTITLQNLSFQYEGPASPKVLDNLNLTIPEGKITAIVGSSGSGKTTLLKLLLKFYESKDGEIRIGTPKSSFQPPPKEGELIPFLSIGEGLGVRLNHIHPHTWRQRCGTVMQDGYIFSDTIAGNIAVDGENIDYPKLLNAVKVANIQEFIEGLPLGYQTKIGAEGLSLSGGQKQRILIARAVYKNPEYLFFDEATSALDANNERVIMQNLQQFFQGKTVVIIAHRLSTVKNADQIVVLEKGKIMEQGTHQQLTQMKGNYFELVRNQLELSNV